jgi:hypothetical protein
MRYLWLVLAIALLVIGIVVGRFFKLSPPAAYAAGMVPPFLAMYPFIKHWMPKASFAYWVTAAAIATATGWLFYFGFTRFGG